MAKSSTANIKFQISNLQQFKTDLNNLAQNTDQIGKKFAEAGNASKELQLIQKSLNTLINSYTTQVDKNGNVTVSSARQMIAEYKKLLDQITALEDAENRRMSASEYDAARKKLTDGRGKYAQAKKAVPKLEQQIQENEQKIANTRNVASYAKGKVSDGLYQQLSAGNYSLSEKTGKLTKKDYAALTSGLSETQKTEFDKLYDGQIKDLQQLVELQRKDSQALKEKKNIIVETEKQLKELDKRGIATEGTTAFTADVKKNVESIIEPLQNATIEGDKNHQTHINLGEVGQHNNNVFAKATKTFFSYRAILRGVRSIIRETIRTVTEMDKALTGMTMVTGKAREEVESFIPRIKEIAQATSSAMTDIANLTTEYLRQGRAMEDALILAEETAKAAKIAGISTTDSIQYMTSAINGFNLAATDAAHVSDVFANVAAKTATNYEQLAVALSKVSAQANLAGMSIEFTTALLAKGIETTQEAPESIGTALKTVVARMRELTDYNKVLEDGTSLNKVERALNSAGIALRDESGSFRDLETVFNELGQAWDDLNGMQQQAIAQAAAGTRQQSRFVAIMQDWGRTLEMVDEAQNAAGASAYQYGQYAKGLEAHTTNLRTAWQGFTTSLVETDWILALYDMVTSVLNTLAKAPALLRTVAVSSGIIMGTSIGLRKLQELRYQRTLQILQLERELGMESLKQDVTENKRYWTIQARVNAIRAELGLEQGITFQEALTTLEKEKQTAVNEAELMQIERKISLLYTGAALEKQTLKYKLSQLALGVSTLFTSAANLKTKQIEYLISGKGILRAIKLLFLKTSQLTVENGITNERKQQVIQAKNDIKLSAKKLGKAAAIAALIAAIAFLVSQIVKSMQAVERAQENILENNNKIYETQQNQSSLKDLIDEYEELDSKINKTAEDMERMSEIENSFRNDYKVGGVDTAKKLLNDYGNDIYQLEQENIKNMSLAFARVGDDIWDKGAEFTDTFNSIVDKQIESVLEYEIEVRKLTADQANRAKGYATNASGNLDATAIMSAATIEAAGRNTSAETGWDIGTGAGFAGAGVLGGLAVAGVVNGWNPVGWVLLAAAAIGSAGLAIASALKSEEANAKQIAAISQSTIADTSGELAVFSADLAVASEKGMQARYEVYAKAMESTYNDYTKGAISTTFSHFTIYEDEYGEMADQIVKALDIDTDTFDALVNKYYSHGAELSKSLIEGFHDNLDKTEKNEILMGSLDDFLENGIDQFEKEWEEEYESKYAKYDGWLNETKDMTEKDKEKLQKYAGEMGWDIENPYTIRNKISQMKASLGTEEDYITEQAEALAEDYLNLISAYQDILGVNQAITGLDSSKNNVSEWVEKMKEGTLTPEMLQTILSDEKYADNYEEILAHFMRGDYNMASALISGGQADIISQQARIYQDYIDRIEGEIKVAERFGKTDQIESLTQQLQIVKASYELLGKYNEASWEQLRIQNKLEELESKIKAGLVGSAEEANKLIDILIEEKEAVIESTIAHNGFGNTKQIKGYIEQLRKGSLTWEEFTSQTKHWTDEQNMLFKTLYEQLTPVMEEVDKFYETQKENMQTMVEAQVKLQDDVLESYKSKLKDEQEALQDSLDKRKEMYEKYFDALEDKDEDADFASEQQRLQQAIATLSSATDATSLSRLKEYQEELIDLEKEQMSVERDRRRDNVMTNLDNENERINQYYETRLENEKRLWEEITKMSSVEIENIMTLYNKEYQNATELNKSLLLSSYADVVDGVVAMIYGTGSKEYTDTLARTSAYKNLKGYSSGGLVNYSGLAMVHGSSSHPEAFLNANQTALFSQLGVTLERIYARNGGYVNASDETNSSITIDNINIQVSGGLDSYTARQTGNSLADAFVEGLKRNGIPVNVKG